MDAPTYPPATAYVSPTPAAFAYGIDTISVEEAVSVPAIRQILIEEAPQMKQVLQASQVQTHISNWSIRSLRTIDLISDSALGKIEARLLALPASQRPVL